jgi:hypothetical protein
MGTVLKNKVDGTFIEEHFEVVGKAELEKFGFSEIDAEIICRNDLFLIEHYEKLYYMTPIELAQTINAFGEDELIRFNHALYVPNYNGFGYFGSNAELMREKINDMAKYTTVNPRIFGEAVVRTTIFLDGEFEAVKEMFGNKTKSRPALLALLFGCYPAFHEHFLKLKTAGVIGEKETGLKWNRDKIAAAEYFDCLECTDRNRRWSVIENVFELKNLRQYLNTHNDRQGKPSRHFEEIKELLDLK